MQDVIEQHNKAGWENTERDEREGGWARSRHTYILYIAHSKKSQELFWKLYKRLNLKDKNVYFSELNHEYGCETNKNFDFVWKDKKKVIEYNGNIWHANPHLFEA